MGIRDENLSFAYGQTELLINLKFDIPDSCLVNVLGPNGAGKTTLFKLLLGLLRPSKGSIFVNGKNLQDLSVRQRARELAYIPQNYSHSFDFEVIDVVLMSTTSNFSTLKNPKAAQQELAMYALERIGIAHLAHRFYNQISGGERQLVLIARALAQNAKTIIMDEPTSALDFGNTNRVLCVIKDLSREGYSIIQSTHQPEQAYMYSDYVLVIDNGKLKAFGKSHEKITEDLIAEIYDIDIKSTKLFDNKACVFVPNSVISTETSTSK